MWICIKFDVVVAALIFIVIPCHATNICTKFDVVAAFIFIIIPCYVTNVVVFIWCYLSITKYIIYSKYMYLLCDR